MGSDRLEQLVIVSRPWRCAWRGMSRVWRRLGWAVLALGVVLVAAWGGVLVWSFRATQPEFSSGQSGVTYWCYPRIGGRGYVSITWGDLREHKYESVALDAAMKSEGVEARRDPAFIVTVTPKASQKSVNGRIIDAIMPSDPDWWGGTGYRRPSTKWLELNARGDGIPVWFNRSVEVSVADGVGMTFDSSAVELEVWEAIRDATARHPNELSAADLGPSAVTSLEGIEWQGIKYLCWIVWKWTLVIAVLPFVVLVLGWGIVLTRGYLRALRGHCPRCAYTLIAPEGQAMCTECAWRAG